MGDREIIDLSYPVKDSMLVYPNTERPTFSWKGRANSEGYNLTRMTMLVHTGTHVDSPLHFLADGASIDEVPLRSFYGEAAVFRLEGGARGCEFGPSEVKPPIDSIELDGIFLIDTGIGKFAETDEYNRRYSWPSLELVRLLASRGVVCYMTDATSVDPVGSTDSLVHKAFFQAGISIVENLANLERLPDGRRFVVSTLPLRLVGREGAPCRAIAVV